MYDPKLIIVLLTGVLCLVLGSLLMSQGYNSNAFDDAINKLSPSSGQMVYWKQAISEFNNKCNYLTVTGSFVIILGIVLILISGYSLFLSQRLSQSMFLTICGLVFVVLVIVVLSVKQLHKPKAVKNEKYTGSSPCDISDSQQCSDYTYQDCVDNNPILKLDPTMDPKDFCCSKLGGVLIYTPSQCY